MHIISHNRIVKNDCTKECVSMQEIKWIWKYVKPYRYRMGIALLLVLVATSLNMVNPYVSGIVVDDVIRAQKTDLLVSLIVIMVVATVIKSVARYVFRMLFESVSQKVIFKMRDDVYVRLQKLDFHFFDKTKTGDIMTRMTGDIQAVRHFVAGVIFMVFENLVTLIFAVTMMMWINIPLTLILLAVAPITGFYGWRLAAGVKPMFTAIRDQFAKLNSVVQENISGNRVVKAFAKESYEIEKFQKENEGFRERNLEAAKLWEKYLPVLETMAGFLFVIMLLVGGIMVYYGTMTIGELVIFSGVIWALSNPMRMAGWLINDVQRSIASASKIMNLQQQQPQIKNPKQAVKKRSVSERIAFKSVSFSYGDEEVLDDITFCVNPGETVAIIGPTGSGKTTLVSLLCRFYDCTKGCIEIDGVDIKQMDIQKLRKIISVAMQDIFLFSDTIEGNIAYGMPAASMEQIKKVATIADAHHFISNLPEGYDTIVGERGVGLSGGQKQRIALARALMSNPSVLVLDDTTSSVDMHTEHTIFKTLKQYHKDKTTFIIAHRISSVKDADKILVLKEGKIIEQGKHHELISQKGYYYNVFVNQFGDFDSVYAKGVV